MSGEVDQIYLLRLNGTPPVQLTRPGLLPARWGGTQPSWSPDGQWITYSSDRNHPGYREIWVMKADGSEARRLGGFGAPCSDSAPAWSPDGVRIAYTSGITIEIVRASDGLLLRTIDSPVGRVSDPDWRPPVS